MTKDEGIVNDGQGHSLSAASINETLINCVSSAYSTTTRKRGKQRRPRSSDCSIQGKVDLNSQLVGAIHDELRRTEGRHELTINNDETRRWSPQLPVCKRNEVE